MVALLSTTGGIHRSSIHSAVSGSDATEGFVARILSLGREFEILSFCELCFVAFAFEKMDMTKSAAHVKS